MAKSRKRGEPGLTGTDRKAHYDEKKKQKQRDQVRRQRRALAGDIVKRAMRYTPYAVAAAVILGVGGWWLQGRPSLPPTDMSGHIESWPPGRILSSPIPEVIQKHILEHVSDQGPPGVIIQYNCRDFACEAGLIEDLTAVARDYSLVFMAPNTYEGKIILTKLGQRRVLDQFDEQAIRDFILP